MPDIQDYIKYFNNNNNNNKIETLTENPPIHIYMNRTNNRLVFKIKRRYNLELQTPETIKLFGSTKYLIDKTKTGNVPNLNVVEVVLVQWNFVDNQYQQIYQVLYSFTSNKSHAYLLYVQASNVVVAEIYNPDLHKIKITLIDQNDRPLEIEGKVNFTLFINP